MVAIVDYGLGNLASLRNLFDRLKLESSISSDREIIQKAKYIILPGVGHFAHGMKNLGELGLIETLNEEVLQKKKPTLGICLGMQLMTRGSEEGQCEGLGWFNADTKRFKFDAKQSRLRVPHVGFNNVDGDDKIFSRNSSNPYFYFTHSYCVQSDSPEEIAGETFHGVKFVSALRKENIWGTQFHPEKSHREGIALISEFLELKNAEN